MDKAEIIQSHVKVLDSKNKAAVGIEGTIKDETRNMITICTEKGIKKLVKSQHTFDINGKKISGEKLAGRPEERLKRWTRR
ncbi:MAG: ribonuclease P protein subunit [Candidatus Woesearchaeota archaeon]